MAVNTNNNDKIHSIPHMQNMGFDREFQVPMVELLVYDPLGNAIKRVTADAMEMYRVNDITDQSQTVYYIGKEDPDGNWSIMKVDQTSGNSFRYATVVNNSGYTTYTNAWDNRESLTYDVYSVAYS